MARLWPTVKGMTHPDRCEFCGIELIEQDHPIHIAGPPPATEVPPPPDWSGWEVLGYTQDGAAFDPLFREVPLPPLDLGPRSVRIGPITSYVAPEGQ
jgi:hypothetical protein